MDGINALIARGGVNTIPSFDVSRAVANALATKGAVNQLALQESQLKQLPSEIAWKQEVRQQQRKSWRTAEEQQKFQNKMSALSAALKADTPEKAKKIYENLIPEDQGVDFSFVGNEITVTYPNGLKLKGPRQYVSEAAEQVAKDPSWATDPQKALQTRAWMAARGISVEVAPTKEPKLYETEQGYLPAEKAIGKKKPRPKATETWGEPYEDPNRPGRWIQKSNTGKIREVTKAPEAGKVPPKVKQAQQLVLRFAKTVDPTVAAIIAANPVMANSPLVKKALDVQIPEEMRPTYEKAMSILDEYYGVEPTKKTEIKAYDYEFIPGKGLVPVQ